MVLIRPAVAEDLDRIAALTAERRRDLARWEPDYWRAAIDADEAHLRYLRFLVSSDAHPTRAAETDGSLVGFIACNPQPGQWFADDLSVGRERPDGVQLGADLYRAITERPALTCVPHADVEGRRMAEAASLRALSSYWRLRLPNAGSSPDAGLPTSRIADLATPPPHTFHPARPLPEDAMLTVVDEVGGYGVASPSLPAPPVYDPGGTTCVIDRVIGDDRARILDALIHAARSRGDVQAVLVIAAADEDLRTIAEAHGWHRIVDVFGWP